MSKTEFENNSHGVKDSSFSETNNSGLDLSAANEKARSEFFNSKESNLAETSTKRARKKHTFSLFKTVVATVATGSIALTVAVGAAKVSASISDVTVGDDYIVYSVETENQSENDLYLTIYNSYATVKNEVIGSGQLNGICDGLKPSTSYTLKIYGFASFGKQTYATKRFTTTHNKPSAVLGHSKTMITVNRYAHSFFQQKRRLMEKLNALYKRADTLLFSNAIS